MTEQTRCHRHWTVKVHRDSLVQRFLQYPLRRVDFETADKSFWVYGAHDMGSAKWMLTPLSILHTLTGLCVEVIEIPRCEECGDRHATDKRHQYWTDGT